MLILDDAVKELFLTNSIKKNVVISFLDDTELEDITNDELVQNTFTFKESLCSSDSLKFGTCEAGSIEFECNDIGNIKGKRICVKIQIYNKNGTVYEVPFGIFTVDSCKRAANLRRRKVIAYDLLYSDNLDQDVSAVINSMAANHETTPVTLFSLKKAVLDYCGISWDGQAMENYENTPLDITGYQTQSSLTGRKVLTSILEVRGKFGKIDRYGNFKEFYLENLENYLYPSATLYPSSILYPNGLQGYKYSMIPKSKYTRVSYEEYQVKAFGKIQIKGDGNNSVKYQHIGDETKENVYVIEDNWLFNTFSFSYEFYQTMISVMFEYIRGRYFTPCTVDCIGMPYLEAGDYVEIVTSEGNIGTFVLSRTLKGIQALRDTFSASGDEISKGVDE